MLYELVPYACVFGMLYIFLISYVIMHDFIHLDHEESLSYIFECFMLGFFPNYAYEYKHEYAYLISLVFMNFICSYTMVGSYEL